MHVKPINDNAATGHTSALSKEQPSSMPQKGRREVRTRLLHCNLRIWGSRNLAGAGIRWERANGFLHSAK